MQCSFKASNNQAEYEALIAKMLLAKEMGVTNLLVKSDSALVVMQLKGEFQARDPQLAKYLEFVHTMPKNFVSFNFTHVPKKHNCKADLLSKMATYTKLGQHKSVIRETLVSSLVDMGENYQIMAMDSWMILIKRYIADG